MKRLLTLAVLFLLLIGTMPVAHAQESIPEVSTLSELQDAIAQAEEGDTIKIMQTIIINFPVTLGIDGKPVTLCGADGLETLLRFEGDWGYRPRVLHSLRYSPCLGIGFELLTFGITATIDPDLVSICNSVPVLYFFRRSHFYSSFRNDNKSKIRFA